MPVNLSIKNVPEELAERLRKRARRHNRSLQGELITILEEAVQPRQITVEELHERVMALGLETSSDAVDMVREDRDTRFDEHLRTLLAEDDPGADDEPETNADD